MATTTATTAIVAMLPHISFEEAVINAASKTKSLYFISPKEILDKKYREDKDVESAEILIEYPLAADTVEEAAEESVVSISPTKEVDGVSTDFDWYEVYLDVNTIKELIKKNHNKKLI